jgi:hypothetical protein
MGLSSAKAYVSINKSGWWTRHEKEAKPTLYYLYNTCIVR